MSSSLQKPQNQFFGTRSSSGWVLTHVRTFKTTFLTLFILIMLSKNAFCLQNTTYSFFWGRNPFLLHSMKSKDVWDVILKVLTHVRTHPGELLVPKIWFFCFFFEGKKSSMVFRTVRRHFETTLSNWKVKRIESWKLSNV